MIATKHTSILFLLLYAGFVYASDVVFFKNGEKLECQVLEFNNGRLTVRDADGEIIEGPVASIKSISFETVSRQDERTQSSANKQTEEGVIDFEVTGSLGPACETPEQKNALARFAATTFQRPIKTIHLTTCWGHPADRALAIVNFKRSKLQGEYFESSRAYIHHKKIPPKWAKEDRDGNIIWGPKEGDAVSGPWFTDRKVERNVVVRYALKGKEKFLGVPDRLGSYDTLHRLLLSIEARDFKIKEEFFPGLPVPGGDNDLGIDVEKIIDIETEGKDGKLIYTVVTSTGSLTGKRYGFELHDGGFLLVFMGFWVS